MLFDSKFTHLFDQLAFLKQELEAMIKTAYPAKRERLRQRVEMVEEIENLLTELGIKVKAYEKASDVYQDTFPQLFGEFHDLSTSVHILTHYELPIYAATTQSDEFISSAIKTLLEDVGLMNIYPVVSMIQAKWFEVRPIPIEYPLFLLPYQILNRPFELPIIYHEIGHLIFYKYNNLELSIKAVLHRATNQKRRQIQMIEDPSERESAEKSLSIWTSGIFEELVETSCDIIGNILGGPAFGIVNLISLLTSEKNVFMHNHESGYPPLDVRMRISIQYLKQVNLLDDQPLSKIENDWISIRELHKPYKPRWYDLLYDDQYINDLMATVEGEILSLRLTGYSQSNSEIRQDFFRGCKLLLQNNLEDYLDWSSRILDRFK